RRCGAAFRTGRAGSPARAGGSPLHFPRPQGVNRGAGGSRMEGTLAKAWRGTAAISTHWEVCDEESILFDNGIGPVDLAARGGGTNGDHGGRPEYGRLYQSVSRPAL